MKTQNQIIHFLADFQLSKPTTTGERTFSGVAYAGGVITDHSWYSAVAFDLVTTSAETPLPLLFNHHGSPIGVIETVSIGTQIEIAGRLFADIDDVAKDIAVKADRGIKWQLSVGIFSGATERLNGTQAHSINGQSFTGEITLLKQNRIREVSFVTLGADDKTSATVFNAQPTKPQESSSMTPEEAEKLQKELEKTKAENAQFKADLDSAKKSARETEIKSLFSALGREYSEEKAKPYFEFSADQFKVVSADLMAQKGEQKPNLPEHLFSAQANDGETKPTEPQLNFSAIYDARKPQGKK
ncbi:MAG: hypothetical protein WBI40_09345 [Methylococcaceae bacterium]